MIEYLISKGFTPGESRVIRKLLEGKSNRQIAQELNLSEKSIKFHLSKAYKKFNVVSRTQLIVKILVVGNDFLMANNKKSIIEINQ